MLVLTLGHFYQLLFYIYAKKTQNGYPILRVGHRAGLMLCGELYIINYIFINYCVI